MPRSLGAAPVGVSTEAGHDHSRKVTPVVVPQVADTYVVDGAAAPDLSAIVYCLREGEAYNLHLIDLSKTPARRTRRLRPTARAATRCGKGPSGASPARSSLGEGSPAFAKDRASAAGEA